MTPTQIMALRIAELKAMVADCQSYEEASGKKVSYEPLVINKSDGSRFVSSVYQAVLT